MDGPDRMTALNMLNVVDGSDLVDTPKVLRRNNPIVMLGPQPSLSSFIKPCILAW